MIRLLFISICLLLFTRNEVTIPWQESYKLTWNDFKGPVKQNTDAVATTASGITFSYSVKRASKRVVGFKTKIFAHFYPEKSWYKPEHVDDHILFHEQYHFNLTELHARKFRQRVAQLQVSQNISKKLDALHQQINTELSNMQQQYDNETNYSRDFEAQARWQDHIDAELAKLSKYKSQ